MIFNHTEHGSQESGTVGVHKQMKSRFPRRGGGAGGQRASTALSGLGVDVACQLRSANGAHSQEIGAFTYIKKIYIYIQNNIQVVEEARLPFRLLGRGATCVEIWFGRTPIGHGLSRAWAMGSIRIRFA